MNRDVERKLPKIRSDYATVDVTLGRIKLKSFLKQHGPQNVVIKARITEPFGANDGTSIMFNADVTSIEFQPKQGGNGDG